MGEYASSLDSTFIGPANFAKKARNNRLEPAPRSVLGIIHFFYCIVEPNKRTLKRVQRYAKTPADFFATVVNGADF